MLLSKRMKVTGSLTNSQQHTSQANSDISFQYEEHAKPEKITNRYWVQMPTSGQVSTIKPNQRVKMSGTLSLGD